MPKKIGMMKGAVIKNHISFSWQKFISVHPTQNLTFSLLTHIIISGNLLVRQISFFFFEEISQILNLKQN